MSNKLFGVISIYGLLIACAILLATLLCQRETRRRGLPPDTGIDMILWAVPLGVICARLYYVVFRWDLYARNPVSILYFWQGGLAIYGGVIGGFLGLVLLSRKSRIPLLTLLDIGARLYYVIFRWDYYAKNPVSALYFWQGGLAIYGAVIGGFIGLCLFSRKSRLPLLTLLDIAAPVVILGQAIGRWGNYFNGEAYGREISDPAWQFFPAAVFADGAWHMATFFYESCWNLLGFLLLWLYRKRAKQNGDVFFRYLLWYGLGRAVIEGLRTDSLMWGPVRVSQALSLLLAAGSLGVILYRRKKAASH